MIANDEEYDILVEILGPERTEELLMKLPGFTFSTKRLKDYLRSKGIFNAFKEKLAVKVIKAMFNLSRKTFKSWKDKFEALEKK